MIQAEYIYIDNPDDLPASIEVLKEHRELALDCETYVLPEYRSLLGASAFDPHTGRISLLQLQGRTTPAYVLDILQFERQGYDPTDLCQLLLSREKLIGQKLQFDFKFLKRHWGIVPTNGYCTRLMARLIGNATGSKYARLRGQTLKDLCRDYLNVHIGGKGAESEQGTDWYPRPNPDDSDSDATRYWQEKIRYAAGDTHYLFRLHDLFLDILTKPLPYSPLLTEDGIPCADPDSTDYGLGMAEVLELEMFQISVAAEMEYNGLPASKDLLQQIEQEIYNPSTGEGIRTAIAADLCDRLGLETTETFASDTRVPIERSMKALNNPISLKRLLSKQTGVNLSTSQTQVINRFIDLLIERSEKDELSFVDEAEAEAYKEIMQIEESEAIANSDICKLVVQYKQYAKLYSMAVSKFINPLTGCIHCSIDMLGAATGRSSASQPNLQQISARTSIVLDRPVGDLYPSSANYGALEPDWQPSQDRRFYQRHGI